PSSTVRSYVRPPGWNDDPDFGTPSGSTLTTEARPDPFGSFHHATESPVTIRGKNHRVHVEAVPVVPTGHFELVRLVIEFNIDARGLRMPERIGQSLSRN